MSIGGKASKTKSTSSQQQTQTNYLGQQGLDAVNSGLQRLAGYSFQGVTPELINRFQNPYEDQVVDAALGDINRAQQQSLLQGGDAAYNARAFGGSRHGVADAITRDAYDRNAQNTVSGLRQQGYNTALSAAQNEAQSQNQWQAMLEGLYGNYASLLSQHGSRSDMTGSGKSTGTSAGLSFEWVPK